MQGCERSMLGGASHGELSMWPGVEALEVREREARVGRDARPEGGVGFSI